MLFLRNLPKLRSAVSSNHWKTIRRTFLSNAYYCNEVWASRLNSPILSQVDASKLFIEMEQRFNQTNTISPVDVDLLANGAVGDSNIDEILDCVHKLRLSVQATNIMESTQHSVVRLLMDAKRYGELLDILDDRLNYGIFLDSFTANMLMDRLWKEKEFSLGAKVAWQMMLQEDLDHPITASLALLHCYAFLRNPVGWEEIVPPEETGEEVKVRVKYLRNPHFDDHFDLKNPAKIVGKTVQMLTSGKSGGLDETLHLVGLLLWGKEDEAKGFVEKLKGKNASLLAEALDLIPEQCQPQVEALSVKEGSSIQEQLEKRVKASEIKQAERDIAVQCKLYESWEQIRQKALDEQINRWRSMQRLENVANLKKELKEKETKLWYFENEENIELTIEETEPIRVPKKWMGKQKQAEEEYIPPEITKSYNR